MALNPPIASMTAQEDGQQAHIHRFLDSIGPYQDHLATVELNPHPLPSPQIHLSARLSAFSRSAKAPVKEGPPETETESAKRLYDRKMRRRAQAAVIKPKGDGIKLGEALRQTVRHSQESRKETERKEEEERKRKASEEADGRKRKKDKRPGTESRTTHPQLFFSPSRRVTIPLDKALGRRLGIKESKAMVAPDLREQQSESADASISDARPNIESHYFSLAPIPIATKSRLPPRPIIIDEQMGSDIHEFARRRGLPSVGIAGSSSWPSGSSRPKNSEQSNPAPKVIPHAPQFPEQKTATSLSSSFRFAPASNPHLTHPLPPGPLVIPSVSSRRPSYVEPIFSRNDTHPPHKGPVDRSWKPDPPHLELSRNMPRVLDQWPWQRDQGDHSPVKGRGTTRAPLFSPSTQVDASDGPAVQEHDPYAPAVASIHRNYRHRDSFPVIERSHTATLDQRYEHPDPRSMSNRIYEARFDRPGYQLDPVSTNWSHQASLDSHYYQLEHVPVGDQNSKVRDQLEVKGTPHYQFRYSQDQYFDPRYYDEYDPYEPLLATPRLPILADTTQDIESQLAEIQYQDHQAAIQPYHLETHDAHAGRVHDYPRGHEYWPFNEGPYVGTSETSRVIKEEMENPFVAPHEYEEGEMFDDGGQHMHYQPQGTWEDRQRWSTPVAESYGYHR